MSCEVGLLSRLFTLPVGIHAGNFEVVAMLAGRPLSAALGLSMTARLTGMADAGFIIGQGRHHLRSDFETAL